MRHSDYKISSFDQEQLVIREFSTGSKSKQALLFVHGLGGDKEAWEICIEKFQSLDITGKYCEFTYDLRGHGFSTRRIYADLPIYKTNAADLKTIVDFISSMKGYSSVVVIGHSFGSFITQQYAHDFLQPIVKKLILISSPSKSRGWKLPLWFSKFLLYLPSLTIIHRNRKAYEKYIGKGDFNVPRLVSDMRSVGFAKYAALESMILGSAVSGRTKKIQIPIYVLSGENDSYFPIEQMNKFQKEIHAKEFIVFHDTNHVVPINNAGRLAKAIFSILEEL